MSGAPKPRRRPAIHITLARAARLHRLITLLAANPRSREEVLQNLGIGLRTFYRELELLKRCGIRIQQKNRAYILLSTAAQAEGRLPFPDPQLSFAEMAELSTYPGAAARRLAELLASVTAPVPTKGKRRASRENAERPPRRK